MAVITAVELQDLRLPGHRPRESYCAHGCLGPRVHEPEHLHARNGFDDHLCQIDLGSGGSPKTESSSRGSFHGLDDVAMSVTQDQRAPGSDAVDVLQLVYVENARPLSLFDEAGCSVDGSERANGRVDPSRHDLESPLEEIFRVFSHRRRIIQVEGPRESRMVSVRVLSVIPESQNRERRIQYQEMIGRADLLGSEFCALRSDFSLLPAYSCRYNPPVRKSRSEELAGRPLGTFGYFFVEAGRRIWISRRNSFVAIIMIAISLFIMGTFLLVSENLGRAVDVRKGSARLVVYFNDDATEDDFLGVETFFGEKTMFADRTFVTPAAALEKFEAAFPNLATVVEDLGENPLPFSYEVIVDESVTGSRAFHDSMTSLGGLSGVDDLQFDWEWMAKLRNLVRTLNLIGLVIGTILGLAAAFMIANVIRLTMVLYREEIGVMRLVGATEGIIRGPFLIEGIIQGFVGGVLSVGLLAALYLGAGKLITPSNAFVWDVLLTEFLPLSRLAALVAAGTLAGLFGSWLAVRDTSEDTVSAG